ncbi:hypothetical protein [Mangrovibacillus cuniculi]|uniref:Uncharacterized protein n=1 Tax=Mangrovibacillus cuniculi TaxID=2593652 RepID=A0A7S8CB91_9BACI|nr:hypothetical protein [Mangrovibacillus cuniculi]QPC46661.1 hypothetical protein G8O30_06650 [Mangrovibacillus cuniculi]
MDKHSLVQQLMNVTEALDELESKVSRAILKEQMKSQGKMNSQIMHIHTKLRELEYVPSADYTELRKVSL